MNYETLDFEQDKDVIIPRALYFSNKSTFESDIQKLENIYTASQIVLQLKITKEFISNEVCELVSLRYSIPIFQRFVKIYFLRNFIQQLLAEFKALG